MTGSSILQADMATIAGWLGKGVKWWLDELRALVPARWAGDARRRVPIVRLDDKGLLRLTMPDGETLAAWSKSVRGADLGLAARDGLVREIVVPAMSLGDLRDYVDLERDRLFPLSGAALLCDAEIVGPSGAGMQTVRIGAVRRDAVLRLVALADEAGLAPLRIGLQDERRGDVPQFDFARILRAEGKLPRMGAQRHYWWAIVGGFVLLNLGLLVWRDQQGIDRLQALVDAQQPAVTVYRAMAGRSAQVDRLAQASAARRQAQRPLADLAAMSTALPGDSWIQRYGWNGRSIELAGYAHGDIDVAAALRKIPRFANVRASNADVQAETPMGRPFGLVVDVRGARQ